MRNTVLKNKQKPLSRIVILLAVFILYNVLNGCKKLDPTSLETTEDQLASVGKENARISGVGTSFFQKNKSLGGDATILNAKEANNDSLSQKVFTIEVPSEGDYYLNAWINSPELAPESKENFLSYDLIVNGVKIPSQFKVKKSGWHSAPYLNDSGEKNTIHLKQGLNELNFSCNGILSPNIDFVRLGKDKFKSDIKEDDYLTYINDLKQKSLSNKPGSTGDTTISGKNKMSTLAVEPASDPLNDYNAVDGSFNYTFYTRVNMNSGSRITLSSTAPGFNHVLEFFSANNPQVSTYASVSNSSGYASITMPAISAGQYIVRVRSYNQAQTGFVNININNGQYRFNDCPVSGPLTISSSHYSNQEYNYFTANTYGDPILYIVNQSYPGKIVAYNDDYWNSGDSFYWGLNSRVKKQFNQYILAAQVSSYSSYSPNGYTTLYYKAKNSNIMGWFPNLQAGDAIMSSPETGNYNCTAWAGGFTSFWFWGSTPSYYYGDPQVWQSWDDYFRNNPERYAGAMTYTPDGADATNGAVAMWALNGTITHGSVRRPGNWHLHGYDWESKPGSLARTFHPRDALNGNSYGSIVKYYQPINGTGFSVSSVSRTSSSSRKGISFEESVAKGLTVIEPVELHESEKSKISSRQVKLPNGTRAINSLYNNWMNTIQTGKFKTVSNPYKFIETAEGQALLTYSKKNLEEAVLYFSSIIFDTHKEKAFEQNISYYMFCAIAQDEYGTIMENIKSNWKKNKYTNDNKYIAPLPETFTKKYIKGILSKF